VTIEKSSLETPITIKINPEYAALIPPLPKETFNSLVESIRTNGQYEPISINSNNEVLDGHNRLRACQLLKVEPVSVKKFFPNILQEKLFVIEANLQRRQLNDAQRIQLVSIKLPILQELTKLNMSKAGKGVQICTPLGRVNNIIAKDAGVSVMQVHKVRTILDKSSDSVKKKVLAGQIKIDRAYNVIRDQMWKAKQLADNKKLDAAFQKLQEADKIKFLEGDFREKASILEANSVDLIFTDPPYNKESLWVYKDLAIAADRLLRPGGSLITYIGQYAWHHILDSIENNNSLQLFWTFCVLLDGGNSRMMHWQMKVMWKPLLWFVRGDELSNPSFPLPETGKARILKDLIVSKKPDKRYDDWGQSPAEAEYCIEKLTAKNDLVLDPFMGGGTTASACIKLKRRFVGIDINPEKIKLAKARLAKKLNSNSAES
jgi:ParB-like chromosome segregation protein Spo0J